MNLKEQNIRIFDRIAGSYDRGIIKKWSLRIQRNAVKSLKIERNSKILDVGCGTGNLFSALSSQNKNLRLYGIDISEKMLRIAKTKTRKKANLRIMPIEKLNDKNKFDYVFSIDSFHHYYNQDLAFEKMFSALKKRGKLIVVDVDFGYVFNKIFHKIEPGNNEILSHLDMIKLFKLNNLKNITQKRIWLFTFMTIGQK
ncbi:MAG: class I SAM-dependent methyltransferase [Nanoarchaeota archaeon]